MSDNSVITDIPREATHDDDFERFERLLDEAIEQARQSIRNQERNQINQSKKKLIAHMA